MHREVDDDKAMCSITSYKWETTMCIIRITKVFVAIAIATFVLVGNPSWSAAASGHIHLKVSKVGFIVGVGGGSGTLSFKGKHYRLEVGGIGVGTIGVASAELVGTANNLHTAADIAGTYSAISGGIAVAGGEKAATLQNEKGVVLHLHGKQVGFEASLSLSGLTISLR
jgi:hypothetical protein